MSRLCTSYDVIQSPSETSMYSEEPTSTGSAWFSRSNTLDSASKLHSLEPVTRDCDRPVSLSSPAPTFPTSPAISAVGTECSVTSLTAPAESDSASSRRLHHIAHERILENSAPASALDAEVMKLRSELEEERVARHQVEQELYEAHQSLQSVMAESRISCSPGLL